MCVKLGHVPRPLGPKQHVEQQNQRKPQEAGYQPPPAVRGFLRAVKQTGHHRHRGRAREQRHNHIQRRMHAQIHARKGHRQNAQNAQSRKDAVAHPQGQHAQHARGRLRVSAGEGIARCACARRLHDGKLRVDHPGAGDEEHRLEQLVEHCACQPHKQQTESPALVEAPHQRKPHQHKEGFLSQQGHGGGHLIPKRGADGLQHL